MRELVETFTRSAEGYISNLKSVSQSRLVAVTEAANQDSRSQHCSDTAHKMKSAAGSLGLLRLSALMQTIEREGRLEVDQLGEVETVYQDSLKAIDQLFAWDSEVNSSAESSRGSANLPSAL